jgi:uncharacterized protein YjiS (DUF1127 family)
MPQARIIRLPFSRRDGIFARLVKSLVQANERRAQRLCLAHLDPHLLRDVGLDATAVAAECAKPFWRP